MKYHTISNSKQVDYYLLTQFEKNNICFDFIGTYMFGNIPIYENIGIFILSTNIPSVYKLRNSLPTLYNISPTL